MKIRQIIRSILMAAVLLAALPSCIHDDVDPGMNGNPIVVGIGDYDEVTRSGPIDDKSYLDGENIGFYPCHTPSGGSAVAYSATNALVSETGSGTNIYTAQLAQTKYWPVVQDGSMKFLSWYPYDNSNLNPQVSFATAGALTLSYTAKTTTSTQEDVMVAVSKPAWGNAVPVHFHHAMTKISFTLVKQSGYVPDATVSKIELQGIPKQGTVTVSEIPSFTSPNAPEFTWNTTGAQTVSLTTNTSVTTTAATLDDKFLVFPASTLTSTMILAITVNGSIKTFPLNTLNTHSWKSGEHINYKITFTNHSYEIQAEVVDWEPVSNDWEITPRYLNLSRDEVNITSMSGARVTFTSNMPHVWIHDRCPETIGGAVSRVVANSLCDIASTANNNYDPSRFHYEYDPVTKQGQGYFDVTAGNLRTIDSGQFQLMIYAGTSMDTSKALLKYIGVNLDITMNHSYTTSLDPIGAFWKNNETGERIITAHRNHSTFEGGIIAPFVGQGSNGAYAAMAKWKATVEYSPEWSGEEFIKLSVTPSFDPKVGTNYPGDAEDFQVTDGKKSVWGRGRTYFRIGLTSTNPDPQTPRYGRVRIDCYSASAAMSYDADQDLNGQDTPSGSYYVWVRQGEEPDYLMRKTDPVYDNTGTLTADTRDNVSKIPVYNLTAKEFYNDPNTSTYTYYVPFSGYLSGNSGYDDTDGYRQYFTKYPTQTGSLFGWMYVRNPLMPGASTVGTAQFMRQAHHPHTTAATYDIYSFPIIKNEGSYRYWSNDDNDARNETCPPGYHRPTDGSTTDASKMTTFDDAVQSETRQSLFRDIPIGLNYSGGSYNSIHTNVNYGIYADGFFERRARSGSYARLLTSSDFNTAVDNAESAYAGSVFYNEANFASVFFPAAGRRNQDGTRDLTATLGMYWTASANPDKDDDPEVKNQTQRGTTINVGNRLYNNYDGYMWGDNSNKLLPIRCFKNEAGGGS